jgi:hypothetical protein
MTGELFVRLTVDVTTAGVAIVIVKVAGVTPYWASQ